MLQGCTGAAGGLSALNKFHCGMSTPDDRPPRPPIGWGNSNGRVINVPSPVEQVPLEIRDMQALSNVLLPGLPEASGLPEYNSV